MINEIYKILKKQVKNYNVPIAELIKIKTQDNFKTLIITILSARTNDKTLLKIHERLFSKINNLNDLEKLSIKEIEELIYPVGFYKNKAKYLKKLPGIMKKEFNGKIPSNIEDLIKLSGVGRKTANIILNLGFNKPTLAIDVHCHRIPNRLGVINTKTPPETEEELKKILSKKYWKNFNRTFVAFGQNICRPISPHCNACPVKKYCKKIGVKKNTRNFI